MNCYVFFHLLISLILGSVHHNVFFRLFVFTQVGDYERLRVQDQQTITKLREKINQLDIENTALATATQPVVPGGKGSLPGVP